MKIICNYIIHTYYITMPKKTNFVGINEPYENTLPENNNLEMIDNNPNIYTIRNVITSGVYQTEKGFQTTKHLDNINDENYCCLCCCYNEKTIDCNIFSCLFSYFCEIEHHEIKTCLCKTNLCCLDCCSYKTSPIMNSCECTECCNTIGCYCLKNDKNSWYKYLCRLSNKSWC